MIEKRCTMARDHKPHWWSRTTRKTVTQETAGDTLQCPGRAKLGLRSGGDERGAQIAADARSGINWASSYQYGPACVCGAFLTGSTVTSWGREVQKNQCYLHGQSRGSQIVKRGRDGAGPE